MFTDDLGSSWLVLLGTSALLKDKTNLLFGLLNLVILILYYNGGILIDFYFYWAVVGAVYLVVDFG